MEQEKYSEEEKALRDFLLDIECLDPLSEWTGNFNLFDVLKITRTEIRHSNVLAWLLDPNENHGLGDSIIRGFIQYGITAYNNMNYDVFSTLLMDCHDFTVQREWHHIDILATSKEQKFVLCIENKIDSGEHDSQLERYKKTIEEYFPGYSYMFIFLSPEGLPASEPEYWCSMSYQDVLNIIEKAKAKTKLIPEADLLIENYVEAIRRDIVGDEKLDQICAEIYAKHSKALDLIFEHKPDRAAILAEMIREWASEKEKQGLLVLDRDKSAKTYTRIKTTFMSSLLPDAEKAASGWNTKNHYYYEVVNNAGTSFNIQLALSARNIPDNLRKICETINKYFPSKQQKENWQWRVPFSTKRTSIDEELTEEKVFSALDKKWEEVQTFEKKLQAAIESER